MSFTAAIASCFAQYAGFQGRAQRSEYWYWLLFCVLVGLVGGFIFGFIGGILGTRVPALVFQWVLTAAILLLSIAVAVRRLHDVDRSGWWYFLVFLPLVGPIILIVWFCTPGTRGPNRFGGGATFGQIGPMPMPAGFN
jgi:uncharacterized membrane protein YhaH (DUF805 family)